MSLINNLLKDLEQRESHGQTVPHLMLFPERKHHHFFANLKKSILPASLFLIFFFLFSFFLFKSNNVSPVKFIDNPAHSRAAPAPANNTDWKNAIAITGVTIQTKDNITEVTFALSHDALYRLVTDSMQNQLSIYIDHAQLQSEIPPIGYLNQAITKITSQQIDDDTRFTLHFTPGATIKHVNLNSSNAHPELVVAVAMPTASSSNIATEATASEQSEPPVKSLALQNLLLQHYQTALLNAEAGRYQLAMQQLTALLKMDPTYKDARVSLVALLIDQGDTKQAADYIKTGLTQMPDYVPFVELKARIFALEGKYKQALQLLQTASPPLEENPEYHAFIAAMYEQNNEYALAAALYKKLLAINTSNGSWWFGLGVSLDKLGQDQNAINAYGRAAAQGHLNAESMAYLQNRLHQLQEAVDGEK